MLSAVVHRPRIRFYLLLFLLNRYGPQARAIIEDG